MPAKPSNHVADDGPFNPRDMLLGALLVFVLLVIYSPAINGGMVFDDDRYITPPELQSLHGLWRIWTEPGAAFQYYPVLHTAFWVEHALWGDGTWGYHLVNIFLHAASAWLVVAIMRKLALPGAWLAAFIFALHPVCVESVAWISEQKNTLSTVFYLGSMLVYLHFDRDRGKRWYFLASGLFLMALLGKTVTATLPCALLVIFWWERGRLNWKRDVLPLLPWLAIGVAGGAVSGWIEQKDFDPREANFSLTFLQHCLLAGRVAWFYLYKLLWPVDLMFNYPYWRVDPALWWQYLFPLGLVATAAVLCLLARKNRGPLAAFLFFTGNLFPVMGFLYIGWFTSFSYVADHFQYLACLGIIVPLASGLVLAARKIDGAVFRRAAPAAAGIILTAFCLLTWRQSRMYRDMETFYMKVLADNPDSFMSHYNYGLVLVKMPGRRPEAMGEFEEALRLKPGDAKLKNMVGFIFMTTPGRLEQAIGIFQDGLKINPDDPETHLMLGSALCGAPGRLNEGIAELETSLRLKPDFAVAHYTLAIALSRIPGRTQESTVHYEEALRLDPGIKQATQTPSQVLHASP